MLLMFLGYLLIAILVTTFFFWLKELQDGIDGIILSIFWPLTVILAVYILIDIKYKEYVKKRIDKMSNGGTINDYSLKELKYIMYGEKIGAYYLTDNVKKQILKNIENFSFEEVFLNDKDK